MFGWHPWRDRSRTRVREPWSGEIAPGLRGHRPVPEPIRASDQGDAHTAQIYPGRFDTTAKQRPGPHPDLGPRDPDKGGIPNAWGPGKAHTLDDQARPRKDDKAYVPGYGEIVPGLGLDPPGQGFRQGALIWGDLENKGGHQDQTQAQGNDRQWSQRSGQGGSQHSDRGLAASTGGYRSRSVRPALPTAPALMESRLHQLPAGRAVPRRTRYIAGKEVGQKDPCPGQVTVVHQADGGTDVQREAAGSAREVVAENIGRDTMLREQVEQKLGLDAIPGLVKAMHEVTGRGRPDLGGREGWMERVMGIEPTLAAWEAAVLPLNYTRRGRHLTHGDGPGASARQQHAGRGYRTRLRNPLHTFARPVRHSGARPPPALPSTWGSRGHCPPTKPPASG